LVTYWEISFSGVILQLSKYFHGMYLEINHNIINIVMGINAHGGLCPHAYCVCFLCDDLDYEELYQQLMQSWTSQLYEITNIYSIILTYNSWKHVDMGRGENNGLMILRIWIQEN